MEEVMEEVTEEVEHSQYVAQLKAEFDTCDTTATGYLDQEELTALCRRLHLDAHLPLLLDTLLGGHTHTRVTFEEFKDGFVSVLSRSLDISTSEDDSSYLQPVVEEVQPKLVKGSKRYGRRSRPDSEPVALTPDPQDSTRSRHQDQDQELSPSGLRRAKLRRSASLDSVESLKSDEEAGGQREELQQEVQSEAPQQEEVELGVVVGGVLTAVCDHLGLQQLNTQDLDLDQLVRKLDVDLDSRVRLREFQKLLRGSAPMTCSTPRPSADLQGATHRQEALLEERSTRSTCASLLTVGQRVLTRLDDGTGCSSPERVLNLWSEDGMRDGRDVLQTLDFPLDERLSLADLTLALDNELLVSGNPIHQAALLSYKSEVQHLQELLDQACRERDKVKLDLDQADQRNLQLIREVDDRHQSMETLNQSRIRELEQDYRDRLVSLRVQAEQEGEAQQQEAESQLQEAESQRHLLLTELQHLRAQDQLHQDQLHSATQESRRLEEDLVSVKVKLNEAQSSVRRLQGDLDQVLHCKFGALDPGGVAVSQEEAETIRDYQLQCRELRDRNDELSSELELLKSQRCDRKRAAGGAMSWNYTQQQESDSDESDMKRSSSPLVRRKLQPTDKTALSSLLPPPSGPGVSIQTELALEQLEQKHRAELDTQVNFYERRLELMRQSVEEEQKDISQAFKLEISELEEQKDISQAFKLEISELEEQKLELEQQVKQLKENLEKHMRGGAGGAGGAGWSHEQERRMQWERAELEQNFAREIGNLVQRLSSEKEQLEAELKLQQDQEVMRVREQEEHQAEGQRLLQELQEQRDRLVQSEQEKLRQEEEFSSQKEVMEEELRLLKEQVSRSQEERSNAWRRRCCQLEEEVAASERRCCQLEARLKEACSQLEESIFFLEHQETLNKHVTSEKEQLLEEVARLKEEQEVHLRAGEQSVSSLKTDRDRLIQDLKEQAMAVDLLQLQLEEVCEEVGRRRSSEEALQGEVGRLQQENRTYTHLADQLSTQIVEMEEEISSLREELRLLSWQLNGTADLVLELRAQINSKSGQEEQGEELLRQAREEHQREVEEMKTQLEVQDQDLERVREQVLLLQQELEQEKTVTRRRLEELEQLVLDLEEVERPVRTQLEEVRSENTALQERLSLLQQEVQSLEEEVARRRRRQEELERRHEGSREEEEQLHKENSRYREEVLELSSRNLQLSNDNAELSARLRGDQESVRTLQERLATVSKEQEEAGAAVRRMQEEAQEEALQQQREKLQQEAQWRQEKQRMEQEQQEKLRRWAELEAELGAELSGVTLKLQRVEEEKEELLREMEERSKKVEAEGQEVTRLHRKLQEANARVEELEDDVRRLTRDKEELSRKLEEQQEQQEETQPLRDQNQELQHKLQVQIQDQQNLRSRLKELERDRVQALDQADQALATLGVLQAQQLRGHHTQAEQEEQEEAQSREVQLLKERLQEEARRSRHLEEALKIQETQSSSQISLTQGQYEKALWALQQRTEELESKLKGVKGVLQEKVQHLKEQLEKSSQTSVLLKNLFLENSELVTALQVTEQRQKQAEKNNRLLEEKVTALNQLLRDIVPTALAT